jgi:uncharacterized membrane protein
MRTTIVMVMSIALGACNGASSTGIAPVSCPTDSTLTYANFGSAFISDNCLSCHTSKEKPALATEAQIQANAAHILQQAVYTDAMPQDNDVTIAERELLGEWIACGAP